MNFLKCNFLREHSFNVIFFTFFALKGIEGKKNVMVVSLIIMDLADRCQR